VLVNDIEYVKRSVLSSLPTLLNFNGVIDKMIENYQSDAFQQTKITLERLIATAEREMTDVIKLIFEHVATLVHASLPAKISNYYRDEKRGKPNVKNRMQIIFRKSILSCFF
jgi:putative hemolysin